MVIGSSSIGRTAGLGPADEGSTPSSRTKAMLNALPQLSGTKRRDHSLGAKAGGKHGL